MPYSSTTVVHAAPGTSVREREPTLRKLTLWSKCSLALLHLFCATAWYLLKPFGLEKAGGTMFLSCMWGFMPFVPPLTLFMIIKVANFIWPGVYYVVMDLKGIWGTAISFWFLWTVLTDTAPTDVHGANHRQPRNAINRAAHDFYYWSIFEYFPLTCVPWAADAKLPPDEQYVFALHPHGIFCWPLFMFAAEGTPFDEAFPGLCGENLTGLIASVLFKLPFIRDFFCEWPYVDASRKIAHKLLGAGRSVFLIPGGEEESVITAQGEDIVVLSKRKGFIRLALSHGASIVPVFGAGNNDAFRTYPSKFGFRRWIQKKLGVAVALYHGRFFTPLPYKSPVRVLIGEPIKTPTPAVKGERPNEELVDEYHKKYITALKKLHSEHVKDRPLQVL